MAQPSPQVYYEVLNRLLLELFGHDWHLGYWLNAANAAEAAQRLNEVMAARLPAVQNMRILDVGCGVGGPACFIAETTGSHVTGLSNSPLGLAEAERFARERGIAHRIHFQLGDAAAMPFSDASFDAVWSCEAIHNVEEKEPWCREIARVLQPGGTAIIGDLFLVRAPENSSDLQRYKQFSFHITTADELIDTLQRHGVRVRESINIGHHVGPQSPAVCAQVCREKAARSEPGSLERLILERTVEATSVLADGFSRGEIGWGIWTGTKELK